ncbi:MAG: uroporphyrinogen-III synthase [Myxococcaceae bacterium]|nr:uroporphyrinogen-III synthase [Myxococcaceae bacterium]
MRPTVLLLRPAGEARDLEFLLEEEGLEVCAWPLLAVAEVAPGPALTALAEQVGRFSWVIPESPTAVRVLAARVRAAGAEGAAARAAFLAPSLDTVRALGRQGWEARHVLPEREAGRLETLASVLTEDDEVLWVGGPGEAAWRGWLAQVPGRVTLLRLYDEAPVEVPVMPPGTVVVVHSPSAAEALALATDEAWRGAARLVASGPATEAALAEHGVAVAAVAARPTTEALVDAALRAATVGAAGLR